MANPNPKNKFQKGDKRAGRPAGVTNVMSKEIKILLREAAEEVGFIQRVREHIRAARDAGGRNWCPIFYSAEARRTRSQFIGDSRVTGNGLPSSLRLLLGSSAWYDTTPDPARNVGGHSRVRRETLGVNPTTFGIRRDSRN
jgi:hypothetical protein